MPLVAVFAILACTYGKCWAKGRQKTPLPGSNGESSAWWGGAVGSWRRGMHDPDDADEELGGLVGDKSRGLGGSAYEYDEKRFSLPSNRGGSKWTNVFSIASRSAIPYQSPAPDAAIPFLSVTGAPTDAPFVPPARSSSAHDFTRWGTRDPQPVGASSAQNNGFLSAGVWRMGSQSRRYNPRMPQGAPGAQNSRALQRNVSVRSTDTFGSRLSDKIFGRFGGATARDNCPSPSVYSPSPENNVPNSFGAAGTYMGLQGVDEDEDEDDLLDEKKHVDLDYDAFLAEARVRDGTLAKSFARGDVTEADIFPTSELPYERNDVRQRYEARNGHPRADPFARPATPPFSVDLPSAPDRLQVSPKKTASTLVRPTAPETPDRAAAADLLLSYASPPLNPGSARPPLPPVPKQPARPRSTSPTKGALTEAPARVPFRQQGPPRLAKPTRSNDPFASIAAPLSPVERPIGVGSPMPAYEPSTTRKSEMSAFSLDAYGALAYSDAGHDEPVPQSSAQTEKRTSTQKLKKPKSRQRLADAVEPGTIVPSATSLQASKATTNTSSTKPRPKSAYAQLPSQRESPPVQLPSRNDLRPVSSVQPRLAGAFDPVFPDSPELKPLQHPNRVRAAVETFESSRNASKPSGHRKIESYDSGRSASTYQSSLARSATAAPTTGYRRPLGNKGLDSDEDGNSSDDSEAIKINRRLSRLILNRSRSQTQLATSPETEDEPGTPPRMSNDSKRLSAMLRQPSHLGGGFGADV